MKILRVSISYPRLDMPGVGLSSYYHSYYSIDNNLIITSKKESPPLKNKPNVQIIEIPYNHSDLGQISNSKAVKILKLIKKISVQVMFLVKALKDIEKFKPDIVHVYSPIPILFGIYCKVRFRSSIIMSLHGTDVERISSSKMYQKLLDIPDAILSVSKETSVRLQNANINKSIEFMGNGFDTETFKNLCIAREKQLVHVANLRWQKGQSYLIRAFAKLCNDYPDFKLIIIGKGELYNELYELSKELGISSNVVFKGGCDRQTINLELNKSVGFVLSSVIEGSPKVVLESMATGTPVVSTDVGNVKTVVKDSGYIVPPKDEEALYLAMKKLIETKKWDVISNMAEVYSKEYTWDKVSQRLEKIYLKSRNELN